MAWSQYDIYSMGTVPWHISGVGRAHEAKHQTRAVEMGAVLIYNAGCDLWVRHVPGRQRDTGLPDTWTDVFLPWKCGGLGVGTGRVDTISDCCTDSWHCIYGSVGGSNQEEASDL